MNPPRLLQPRFLFKPLCLGASLTVLTSCWAFGSPNPARKAHANDAQRPDLRHAVSTQRVSSPRDEIERQYKRWANASLRNDVETVLSILDPTYTLNTFDGKVIPLDKYTVSLKKRRASGKKPTNYITSMESIEPTNGAANNSSLGAQMDVISLETSITNTPDPITNKIEKLIHIHQYRDSWVRRSTGWRITKTVTLVEKTTIAKG